MRTLPLRAYVAVSLLFAAIGVWIVVAPTAVAYQPGSPRGFRPASTTSPSAPSCRWPALACWSGW